MLEFYTTHLMGGGEYSLIQKAISCTSGSRGDVL